MEWTVTEVKQTTEVLQLEKCVNDHDGIELKVAADWVGQNDFAIYDDTKLIGYLQAFAYLPTEWEINVFVDPDYRKQGVFTHSSKQRKRQPVRKASKRLRLSLMMKVNRAKPSWVSSVPSTG